MKRSSRLAKEILTNEILAVTEQAQDNIFAILDLLTDENCEALPNVDKNLVTRLQAISESLYNLNEETIPLATEDLVATIENEG